MMDPLAPIQTLFLQIAMSFQQRINKLFSVSTISSPTGKYSLVCQVLTYTWKKLTGEKLQLFKLKTIEDSMSLISVHYI